MPNSGIDDGVTVQRKDKPGIFGTVSRASAAVAGLFMGNPEWTDTTVFVVFDDPGGINLGWFHTSDLEIVQKNE